MREIKFRAWDKFAKEWMDPPIIDGENGLMMGFSLLDGSFQRCFSKGEVALMQYTGLTDKNGKEIYEGDIYKDSLGYIYEIEFDEFRCGYVPFAKGDGCGCCSDAVVAWSDEGEIIGNVYENPELLEATK